MRDRDRFGPGAGERGSARRVRLVLLGGLVALVVAGAALAATRGGASAKQGVDTLVIANAVKVDSIDPAVNSANESIWLDQNIYNRLVQSNAAGTALQPDLATSWDDLEGRAHLHLPPAEGEVLGRLSGDGRGRPLLDRPLDEVQGRLGLPARLGQERHRAEPADARDQAEGAARAAARRPGDVRVRDRARRSW